MIIYAVTINIQSEISEAWLAWMRAVHIPDVMNAAGFLKGSVARVIDQPPSADHDTFVISYLSRSKEELDEYQTHHAPRLQKDHADRFAGRFTAARMVLEMMAEFEG